MLGEDFEYFLSEIYTPLKSIENIADIIYQRMNENWDFLKPETRKQGEELLSLNYAIKLSAKHLLNKRNCAINSAFVERADSSLV